ncbi:hypothetical [Prochlorococcus marinus str. MIT 9313]|uniref:Uncharacterized protein n=2 Tax=Prochlorococcus marinus TaxID=1219 RepID=Q7V784_PROMM|nr:hypothetical [Prochlorococcus marinus str. MIT 9313]
MSNRFRKNQAAFGFLIIITLAILITALDMSKKQLLMREDSLVHQCLRMADLSACTSIDMEQIHPNTRELIWRMIKKLQKSWS